MRDDLHLTMFEIPSDFFSETMSKQENAIYITEGAAEKRLISFTGVLRVKPRMRTQLAENDFFHIVSASE